LKDSEVVDICANPECEWPIYKGEKVWRRGKELYCHLKCLVEVMTKEKPTDGNQ